MRFILALGCLFGFATAAAVDKATFADVRAAVAEDKAGLAGVPSEMVDIDPTKVIEEIGWKKAIQKARPSVQSFETQLLALSDELGIDREVAEAVNITAEVEHWHSNPNNPDELEFADDNGQVALASMSLAPPAQTLTPVMSLPSPLDYNTQLAFMIGPLSVSPFTPLLKSYDNVKFHFFNKYDKNDIRGVEMDFNNVETVKDMWDPKLPLKVIIHGFTNTVKSPVIQMIKNAYLKTGKYNVIGVDWGQLAPAPYYIGARENVGGTGDRVGKMLDKLVQAKMTDLPLIHIIGHSLGAHVAGIAAKTMKSGSPARVTGLDPAGPLFALTGPSGMIQHTDADLVDIIHTNAGRLGKSNPLGTIDFYPNGGKWQTGCFLDFSGTCSHLRSYELFTHTILNGEGLEGYFCSNLPASSGNCYRQRTAKTFTARMGDILAFKKQGSYYVAPLEPSKLLRP